MAGLAGLDVIILTRQGPRCLPQVKESITRSLDVIILRRQKRRSQLLIPDESFLKKQKPDKVDLLKARTSGQKGVIGGTMVYQKSLLETVRATAGQKEEFAVAEARSCDAV